MHIVAGQPNIIEEPVIKPGQCTALTHTLPPYPQALEAEL